MRVLEWLKMKLRKDPVEASTPIKEFDEMLAQEREAATIDKTEAQQQHRQARQVREQSWYLHGRFEQARTHDAFSEWLFSDRGRTDS